MRKEIRRYVNNCYECKRNKSPKDKTLGLLHPLPILLEVWDTVVVDGKDMPEDKIQGFNYVWVFICKLSRFIAIIPRKKTDTAQAVESRYY